MFYTAEHRCRIYSQPPTFEVFADGLSIEERAHASREYSVVEVRSVHVGAVRHCKLFKNAEVETLLSTPPMNIGTLFQNVNEMNRAAAVFLHDRRTPRGERRLVFIRFQAFTFVGGFHMGEEFKWVAATLDPGLPPSLQTWNLGPSKYIEPRGDILLGRWRGYEARPGLKIFAGQADERDPSHFTIRLTCGDAEQVLDGTLSDNDPDPVVTLRYLPWKLIGAGQAMQPSSISK